MISPRFSDAKLDNPSIDDLLDVFEDRIRGWILDPAKSLLSLPHGDVAAFCLLLTYFEGAWSYNTSQASKSRSAAFFASGFLDVLAPSGVSEPLLHRIALVLYADARCGFFHDGLFRERVYFVRSPGRVLQVTVPRINGVLDENGEIQSVLVDALELHRMIDAHLARTIKTLRDKSTVARRTAFATFFKSQCDWTTPGPIIGVDRASRSSAP